MYIRNIQRLICRTRILIAPGYSARMVNGIITNFHQPQSTLLLLIAALVGDEWKRLYQYALDNDFRFLSYGDGMMIRLS
jgi:S-adenosylmethionine:tRNA ribosyltransferase-isomerase